ncbi:hypothetical protein K8I61_10030 [bacterium]|nr:hypothetical protein [bacterium]
MRLIKIISLVVLALALAIAGACTGGGGDDDDDDDAAGDDDAVDDDDDADDDDGDDDDGDDDAGDDDDDLGDLTVSGLSAPACAGEVPYEPESEPYDIVDLEWDGETRQLHVTRRDVVLSCEFDLTVTAEADGADVRITETDTAWDGSCLCVTDVSYTVEGIDSGGTPTVEIVKRLGAAKITADSLIVSMELDASPARHNRYFAPMMDLLLPQGDQPYAPGESFQLRSAPCYLYEDDSVQMSYRVDDSAERDGGGIVFFTFLHRQDLDSDAEPDPLCPTRFFDMTIPVPGTFTFVANSWNVPEQLWEVIVNVDAAQVTSPR